MRLLGRVRSQVICRCHVYHLLLLLMLLSFGACSAADAAQQGAVAAEQPHSCYRP